MKSYRFLRRSFLAGLGGAFGLEILLGNLEAGAEGVRPPPRFFVVHWPRGTVRHHFVPSGSGTSYVASPLLLPFEVVRSETIALYGLSHEGVADGGGGPHAAGIVRTMTGANSPGTSGFSVCAGGPSWDQIFLKNVPALARRDGTGIVGRGYWNTIGDVRLDPSSTGGRAISFSYVKQTTTTTTGGTIQENVSLTPTASPLEAYNILFSGFMPGAGMVPPEALKALAMKKSVLDSALRELARVRELAPASERLKLDAHEETIRKMEADLARRMMGMGPGACTVPPPPPPDPRSTVTPAPPPTNDELEQRTLAQASVIRAAFACDLIRVATLQLASPSHDTAADAITDPNFFAGPPPEASSPGHAVYQNATDLHGFYVGVMAKIVTLFKDQVDGLDPNGAKLLTRTLLPFVTEASHCGHALDRLPAMMFGGSALGMQGGQFQNFESSPRPFNDFWVTLAQALFATSNPLAALEAETFVKAGVAPIPGLWVPPA